MFTKISAQQLLKQCTDFEPDKLKFIGLSIDGRLVETSTSKTFERHNFLNALESLDISEQNARYRINILQKSLSSRIASLPPEATIFPSIQGQSDKTQVQEIENAIWGLDAYDFESDIPSLAQEINKIAGMINTAKKEELSVRLLKTVNNFSDPVRAELIEYCTQNNLILPKGVRQPQVNPPPIEKDSENLQNSLLKGLSEDISYAYQQVSGYELQKINGMSMEQLQHYAEQSSAPQDPYLVCDKCHYNFKEGQVQLFNAHLRQHSGESARPYRIDSNKAHKSYRIDQPAIQDDSTQKESTSTIRPVPKPRKRTISTSQPTEQSNTVTKRFAGESSMGDPKVTVEQRKNTADRMSSDKKTQMAPVNLEDIKSVKDLEKLSCIASGIRKVYTDGARVYKVSVLNRTRENRDDLRLNEIFTTIYEGKYNKLATFDTHQLSDGTWIVVGPLLPGRSLKFDKKTIPKSLLDEMAKHGFHCHDLKPNNFWVLPDESGEVRDPSDKKFDPTTVVPLDAKFIAKDGVHTRRHQFTPEDTNYMPPLYEGKYINNNI